MKRGILLWLVHPVVKPFCGEEYVICVKTTFTQSADHEHTSEMLHHLGASSKCPHAGDHGAAIGPVGLLGLQCHGISLTLNP